MGIEIRRVTRSHICGPRPDMCEDPGAHFRGSDDDWGEYVKLVREVTRLRGLLGNWGDHNPRCRQRHKGAHPEAGCDCGWTNVKRELAADG